MQASHHALSSDGIPVKVPGRHKINPNVFYFEVPNRRGEPVFFVCTVREENVLIFGTREDWIAERLQGGVIEPAFSPELISTQRVLSLARLVRFRVLIEQETITYRRLDNHVLAQDPTGWTVGDPPPATS